MTATSLPRLTQSTDRELFDIMADIGAVAPHCVPVVDELDSSYYGATFYGVPGGPYHTVQRTKNDCFEALAMKICVAYVSKV